MLMIRFCGICLCLSVALAAESGRAANVALTHDRAAFEAHAVTISVGGDIWRQTFDSFPEGTNLRNNSMYPWDYIQPGFNFDSNLSQLEAISGELFGYDDSTRSLPEPMAFYDIIMGAFILSISPSHIGFDIVGFNPVGSTPGLLQVHYSYGAPVDSFVIPPVNASEDEPLFIGLTVIDTGLFISHIRWFEGRRITETGLGGNEETSLDNFVLAFVPEPGAIWPMAAWALATLWRRARRETC